MPGFLCRIDIGDKKKILVTDDIFNVINIVEPKTTVSFEPQNISCILKRFPCLKTRVSGSALINEWREYCLLEIENVTNISATMPAAEYWKNILRLKDLAGKDKFPNLKFMINLLLVLPCSNASVERVFSKLKLLKTDHRNRLNTETIAALMATSSAIQKLGGISVCEPSTSMINKKINY